MNATMHAAITPSIAAASVTQMGRQAGAKPDLDGGRIRDIVLVRVATAGKVFSRSELADDLWPLVGHALTPSAWTAMLDRDLGALADAGLCDAKPVAVAVSEAGRKRAALVLGVNALPRTWTEAKAGRLIAKALGIEASPARRTNALAKADGLRAAIVQQAFQIKMRGLPTPARLRAQLAKLAVSRAFGNSLPADVDDRSGLSAKAGRHLAGRLAHPPRDFATDSRLIAALAMEHAGARKADFDSLQTALLRRYVTRGPVETLEVPKEPRPQRVRRATPTAAARANALASETAKRNPSSTGATLQTLSNANPLAAARPTFSGFVATVRTLAGGVAEGWPGNRKAFVSKVWTAAQALHPEWRLSDVEFKAMLAEAHRAGQLVLANADLKDQRSIGDIQASAIAYKNTIFHYVRVDD